MRLSRFAILLLIPLLGWIPVSCSKQKEANQATGQTPASEPSSAPSAEVAAPAGLIPVGNRVAAPQIDAQAVDGASFSLARSRGKVVLVDFWATWCPPCRKAIPHLIDLQRKYGSNGLQVVGISLDQQGKPIIDPYVRSAGINYPVIADPLGNYANLYGGVEGIPSLFMIDKSGRIAGKIEGYQPQETIERAVKSLLSEG